MGILGRNGKPVATCDLPVLRVGAATVETVDDYRDLCVRCLRDPAFATSVQQGQIAAAERACDPARWWSELADAYQAWQLAKAA
jgi:DNA-directed RNA polymerase